MVDGESNRKDGEFWIRERCYIRELVNDPEIAEFSLAIARVEPGVTTELHALSVDEWYVVMDGTGEVEVGGERRTVGPGDVVAIPAGTPQRIFNSGDADLRFQCVCLPRFSADGYEPLEDA
jgi:mannose-6-phosphate isomerase-like protein (cupin superfamily)